MMELKPCPFCKGKAYVKKHVFIEDEDTFGVCCWDCCAETWQFFTHIEEAARAWNRRTDHYES